MGAALRHQRSSAPCNMWAESCAVRAMLAVSPHATKLGARTKHKAPQILFLFAFCNIGAVLLLCQFA